PFNVNAMKWRICAYDAARTIGHHLAEFRWRCRPPEEGVAGDLRPKRPVPMVEPRFGHILTEQEVVEVRPWLEASIVNMHRREEQFIRVPPRKLQSDWV